MDKKNPFILLTLIAIALFAAAESMADEIRKIAVFPFEVHSRTNAASLQNAIDKGLPLELLKSKFIRVIDRDATINAVRGIRVDEATALSVGKALGADLAITGSLSEFGELISIDARIIDIRQGKTIPGIFAQGRGAESMPAVLTQLKKDILMRAFVDQRIAGIEFKGNIKIEAAAIHQALKSSKGGLYSEADVTADIRAIYRMGHFQDVTAGVADTPEGKIITYTVQERAIISDILVKGNKKIGKGDVEGVLTVKAHQIVNPEKVKKDVEKIRGLYHSKGYYNVEITDQIEKEGNKNVRIVFNIVEGDRLYVRKISFEGNRAFREKELKNIMKTSEKGLLSFFTDSGVLKDDELKQDIGKLNAFYLNNGFINAQVGEAEVTHDQKGIYLKIPVTEGKQFKVGKIDITGDSLKISKAKLLENLKVKQKDYFDREAVMKDIDYLTQACNDEGYAYAEVTPLTRARDADQAVDITFQVSKGYQVYFNRISITGNTKTRDKVIRRQLAISEGDLYSSSSLKKSYQDLNRLRYFEEIDFQSEKGIKEDLTDVNIRVKEKPTGLFSVGAGYSAMDGALLSGQISQQNLFGRGQILSLKANLGERTTQYEISFIEPWLFDMPLWSKFDIWNYNREYDTYNLASTGGGVTVGYPIWEYVTGYLGYRLSSDDVKDIQATASTYIKRQEGLTTTSSLTASAVRDTTNDNMFPSKGSKNSASVTYAGGFLMGNATFTKLGVASSWFFALPLETVFGIYGRAGYLQSNSDRNVPVYERFVLGGISTLRGLRDIGPKDPATGDILGGLTMITFSGEVIFPLIVNAGLKGVVFYDTGNSWESGYNLGDMRQTAGVGIRWYSPIGPLRLEYGFVLDRKANESAGRFEFTIGMMM
ncbi:MAG: outer membrane protein assembly factor BamA [Pseudomonadota bacterium]